MELTITRNTIVVQGYLLLNSLKWLHHVYALEFRSGCSITIRINKYEETTWLLNEYLVYSPSVKYGRKCFKVIKEIA